MSEENREVHAKMVEMMIHQRPWSEHQWARAALAIAAKAIRRGRHLTETEKLENLADAFEADDIQGANSPTTSRSPRLTRGL